MVGGGLLVRRREDHLKNRCIANASPQRHGRRIRTGRPKLSVDTFAAQARNKLDVTMPYLLRGGLYKSVRLRIRCFTA